MEPQSSAVDGEGCSRPPLADALVALGENQEGFSFTFACTPEAKAKFRRGAEVYLNSAPLGNMMLMRLGLEPLRAGMATQF